MKLSFVLTFFLFLGVSLSVSLFASTLEIQDTYSSVSCLAQGNACTASVSGFAAHFYNPAGVGRFTKKQWESHLVVAEGHFNGLATDNFWQSKSIGTYHLSSLLQNNPGNYHFESLSTFPSITFRNFSFGILATSVTGAISNGNNITLNSRQDVIPTFSFARHFAGNLLRVGLSLKGILRNELQGDFSHSTLNSMGSSDYRQLAKEGWGGALDLGFLLTLPHRYLPTLGISWLNAFDTYFSSATIFNSSAQGKPAKIPESFNVGVSVNPKLNRGDSLTLSADFRHIELSRLPLRKKIHVGFELKRSSGWYFWGGLNQLYLTGGIGLRLPGGNLELGSYSADIGEEEGLNQDRRYLIRYTVSFGS